MLRRCLASTRTASAPSPRYLWVHAGIGCRWHAQHVRSGKGETELIYQFFLALDGRAMTGVGDYPGHPRRECGHASSDDRHSTAQAAQRRQDHSRHQRQKGASVCSDRFGFGSLVPHCRFSSGLLIHTTRATVPVRVLWKSLAKRCCSHCLSIPARSRLHQNVFG